MQFDRLLGAARRLECLAQGPQSVGLPGRITRLREHPDRLPVLVQGLGLPPHLLQYEADMRADLGEGFRVVQFGEDGGGPTIGVERLVETP
ncbi:hypothetical protein GCM10010193_66660 [Kitasatospora atroaurantiaca]|uniref:Uncharacterized protein n=1 Tax=Kitasatospora atroaurantiaca TaxID=285545 RepID=A0A561EKA4_9ACTN|nr:hypothetical protein [Kitasatospora atroaurantiaca]TWE16055.1 hypothetical protein FB465_1015 [Kitasatospora atroaurantiaca]